MDQDDLAQRLADLSPAKRALLELRLKEKGLRSFTNPGIPRRTTGDSIPLSFAQQRLWFLDKYEPNRSVYNVPSALRLSGELDRGALKQSLNEIVRRHEVLRTKFPMVEGEPLQVISPSLAVSLPMVDLTDRSESEREDEARRLAAEEARRPFDLSQGPLVRMMLLRLAENEHVLLLTMQHIVSDGWSMGVLHHELSVLYEAFSRGQPSSLPELPIQYADFAIWQREYLQGEVLERQLSYWKKQLEGIPAVLNLSADHPRPAVQSFRGRTQSIELSKGLTEGLKGLSRKEGVTLFMTLLAAFQTLLYRYTGQEDIVVGSPIANRNQTEIEGLIGFFVNTLVLRSDLSGNPTFGELLDRVRKTALEAYDHQDFPFEKLVEELQPERSLSHSPLFQVMFVLQNTPPSIIKLGSLRVNSVRMAGETAKFDLTLLLREEAGELKGSLQYNTDLFATATIKRMLGHFGTLLEGIISNPQARISELPILTDAAKHQLLVEWNDTERDYPKDKRIEQLFEEQVQRAPDAVSVVFDGQELTYRELNSRANQLARYLQKQGVVPETLLGICMERSLEMVVGILGVLKAGGAYVPLDPSYPSQRLAFMIRDSRAEVVLTQRVELEHLRDHRAKMIALDRDWDEIAKENPSNGQIHGSTDSIAYVMYTSGSTGEPKGVEIPHRGVVRLLFGVDYVRLDANQTFLHMAPIAFDASTFEIWGALLHGARCALYPEETPSPKELGKLLKKHQVSTLWLTSALFNTVIDEAPDALKGVSQLLIGGEALSLSHVRRALTLLPHTQIINGYGPTESTTFTCCYRIPKELGKAINSIPIGRPIGNSQVYILDRYHQPVPIGVTGELYIGGDGLARCYLNQPELTDQKFMLNPFSRDPQSRLYQTGDLGRYLQNGNIEFIGRTDNQVKIRGYRIELDEIEATLRQHPGIREVKVLAYEDQPGDKRLAAYIVIEANQPATGNDLRNYLREKLPGYMIPSAFISLDSLPLTPNGKVDYRALPDPHGQYAREKNAYVAPRNETEKFICQLWSEALKIDRVGIDDDFFSLGGHSLLAAKLFARLDEKFGHSLPLGVLFAAPTIRALAERYRAAKEPSKISALVGLTTGGTLPPVFAVPGVFGNVVGLADLARELGSEQPFYGLQSVGLDGGEAPLDSIKEMAALYVGEIRSVQPHGPYAIIGACFGATVAYEMARQLLAAGEEVGFLGLLDPTRREGNIAGKNPESTPRIFKRMAAFGSLAADRLQLYREEMRRLGVIDRVKYLASKLHLLSGLIGNSNAFKGAQRELNQIEVYRANLLALDVYRREPLNGCLRALEIFETTRPGRVKALNRIDWQTLWKGPIKNHKVPGKNSGDMLSGENARVLGALLTQELHLTLHASQRHCSEGRWID